MDTVDLANLRREYSGRGIEVTELHKPTRSSNSPVGSLKLDAVARKSDTAWFEPNAMVLSTADAQGRPSARTVLLKRYGPEGFTVLSRTIRRARAGTSRPTRAASLLFPWYPLDRQVIVTGEVGPSAGGRERRLLRDPAARRAARRLGQRAVAGDPGPRLAGRALRPVRPRVPGRRAATAALGRPAWSLRRPSSSGRAGRAGCTIGCDTCAKAASGGWSDSALEASLGSPAGTNGWIVRPVSHN